MPEKVQVTIKGRDNFTGICLGESTTHYLVAWESNLAGEWFAKDSQMVFCEAR
jgi:hypothetical protein